MTWKREHKENIQSHYGGYCVMCKVLGQEPVPYHKFDMDEYKRVKSLKNNKLREDHVSSRINVEQRI